MVMLLTAESSSGQDEMVGAPGLAHSTTRLVNSEGDGESPVTMVPIHPLGIKPAGNAYTSSTNIRSTIGAFATLPDELIIRVLDYLDAPSLLQLGTTCKALYAFCRLEDLWKALFIGYGRFPISTTCFALFQHDFPVSLLFTFRWKACVYVLGSVTS